MIFLTIFLSFFKRLSCVSFLWHTFDSFLLEFTNFQKSWNSSPCNVYLLTIFLKLQILYFIQLNSQFILRKERILFHKSIEMFKPLNCDSSLWLFCLHILSTNSIIKRWIFFPLFVKFMNRTWLDIEYQSNFLDCQSWASVLNVILCRIHVIKFFRKELKCSFCYSSFTSSCCRCEVFSSFVELNINVSKLFLLFLEF